MELLHEAEALVAEQAHLHGCSSTFSISWQAPPTPMDEGLRGVLARAATRAGAPAPGLPSGAGHDAAVLAGAGVPTAMVFVRSLAGGVSHTPAEQSSQDDIAVAIEVLRHAIGELAGL
jgi:N-carbamoyl-L-amino-acid hydrolase